MQKITKLKFKGDSSKATKKRKIEKSDIDDTNQTKTENEKVDNEPEQEETNFEPQIGTGRITSSAMIVHGHFTKFMDELSPGDAIIVTHPTTMTDEMKVVRMVVSNISLGISSPFSSDLISTTSFRFIKAPKDSKPATFTENKRVIKSDSEEAAFGTYASKNGQKFVYREKKVGSFGGYKIVTEDTKAQTSREDLLNMRSKKKSDRYCY